MVSLSMLQIVVDAYMILRHTWFVIIKKCPCVECGQPTTLPKGNWNARAVVLCESKKCRRKRKTALQKERRRQMTLTLLESKVTYLPEPFEAWQKKAQKKSDGFTAALAGVASREKKGGAK